MIIVTIIILIPSGMLCIAIAMARTIPSSGLATPTMKVAMPSGKLWMAMAAAVCSDIGPKIEFINNPSIIYLFIYLFNLPLSNKVWCKFELNILFQSRDRIFF